MAFTQDTFATVGAQATDTPTVYSYKTSDTLAQVRATDYFVSKVLQLEDGDVVVVDASDGADILQITSDSSTGETAKFLSKINNRVVVNSASDFPAAVAGRRKLVKNTEYHVGQNDVDVGTDEFDLPTDGGNVVISGSPGPSTLKSTTTGTMFTGGDQGLFVIDACFIDCPNGKVVNITDTSPSTTLVLNDMRIVSCASVGDVNSVLGLNVNNITALDADQGLLVTGAIGTIIAMRDWRMVSTSATFKALDLGASVNFAFESLNLLMNAPAGAVGLDGAANSANFSAGTVANVTNSTVIGGGALLSANITVDDVRWDFSGNGPVPDTNPDTLLSISGSTTETVISVASTPVLVAGTWTVDQTSFFTGTTGGRSTYDGERDLAAPVDISATIESATGAGKFVKACIAVNGSVVTSACAVAKVGANDPRTISIPWQVTFSENDFVELFVQNDTDTVNLVVTDAILRIR